MKIEMSALDIAFLKIDYLERENQLKELRLSALRCRLTELIENPQLVIVKSED